MRPADIAREKLSSTGVRVTPSRVRVLASLLQAERALSHHELESRLAPIDRVTLYRVLDWLVENGVAHRVSGTDRVWRFGIAGRAHDAHAHFQCNVCGKVLCLADTPTRGVPVQVPRGYRSEGVELTVKGLCADCN
jgi:Fur family ferric uptake transcriptional regulator